MDRQTAIERNIWRYQVFSLAVFTPFMMPVIVLFWRENGLDLVDVHLLQAIFAVAIVVLEVPTGMVADRLGKRASLEAGMWAVIVGMLVYALGHSFSAFLAAELLLALGISLHSGAGSALLFDSLEALDRAAEFSRYEGRARGLQLVAFGLCTLAGGLVGAHSYRATVWMTAAGPLLALVMARLLVEVQTRPARPRSWREGVRAYNRLIAEALRFVYKHRLVRWQIVFLALLTASGIWLLWIYQPYMELAGLPVWAFGLAFTLFNLVAATGSHLAHRVDRACGRVGTLVLICLLQLLPPALLARWIHPLSFLWILGQQAARGLAAPILGARILRYTYADKRATVLSLSSMGGRLFYALTAPGLGWLAERSLVGCLWLQAAALLLLLGALLCSYARIPAKYFTVKQSVIAQR
jgi:MFS family permease